jgi:hypothetical protein
VLRDPGFGRLYVLVLGFLCGWMGFRLGWRSGNRIVLPLLQGGMGFLAFLYAWTFAGPLPATIAVAGWALGTTLPAIATFRRQPKETDVRVLRAAEYRGEMLGWLSSGVGPEAQPRRTALAHLRELAVYLVAAAATANAGALVLGAFLLNYMNAYVARLLGAARRPWTVRLLAWNVWSLVRVAGYVLLGVACAGPLLRLSGRPGDPREIRTLALAGALAVFLDLLLKLLLSPAAGRRLAAAVDLERAAAAPLPVPPSGLARPLGPR